MGSTASAFWQRVVADGLRGPRRPPARRPDGRAHLDAGIDQSRALRDGIAYPTLATWIEPGRLRRPAVRPRRRHGRRPGCRDRGDRTRTRSSGGRSPCWPWPSASARNNKVDRLPSATRSSSGATAWPTWYRPRARPPGLRPGEGLGARDRPRRRRHRRSRRVAAPRHARAHRDARRARRPAPAARRAGSSPAASPTGWPRPRWRSCAATWCRSRCSSRGSPGSPRRPGQPATRATVDPFLADRQPAGLPARALPPALARRRASPTCRSDLLLALVDALKSTNPYYFTDVAN